MVDIRAIFYIWYRESERTCLFLWPCLIVPPNLCCHPFPHSESLHGKVRETEICAPWQLGHTSVDKSSIILEFLANTHTHTLMHWLSSFKHIRLQDLRWDWLEDHHQSQLRLSWCINYRIRIYIYDIWRNMIWECFLDCEPIWAAVDQTVSPELSDLMKSYQAVLGRMLWALFPLGIVAVVNAILWVCRFQMRTVEEGDLGNKCCACFFGTRGGALVLFK